MDSPAHPSPSIFRHRDFRLFWATRFTATLGIQAESVAIGWQVYDAARRAHASVEQGAFLVGMVGLAQFLPLFLCPLLVVNGHACSPRCEPGVYSKLSIMCQISFEKTGKVRPGRSPAGRPS